MSELTATDKVQYFNHVSVFNTYFIKIFPMNYFHILLNYNTYRVIPSFCYISKKCLSCN